MLFDLLLLSFDKLILLYFQKLTNYFWIFQISISYTEIIKNWEVNQKKKEYQALLINLRNKGETLSKRDIKERLDWVEKIIRNQENRMNSSVDDIGYNNQVVLEVVQI